jgi:WD40 repeat protein
MTPTTESECSQPSAPGDVTAGQCYLARCVVPALERHLGAARTAPPKPTRSGTIFEGHQAEVNGVCPVTVNGHPMLASASDDCTGRIWDLATGQQHTILEGHQGRIRGICPVTVNGQPMLATASEDRTVRVWDPAEAESPKHSGAPDRSRGRC